jgi:hypothetical protein
MSDLLDTLGAKTATNSGKAAAAKESFADTRRRVPLLRAEWTIATVVAWLLVTYTGLPPWAGVLVGFGLAFGL